jgi:myo-inositol-1(or 4)-monophosphatase
MGVKLYLSNPFFTAALSIIEGSSTAISIAVKHEDKITHGIVFDPNRNDIYTAEIGKGAQLNNGRLRVSKTNNLEDILLATGFPTYNMDLLEIFCLIRY